MVWDCVFRFRILFLAPKNHFMYCNFLKFRCIKISVTTDYGSMWVSVMHAFGATWPCHGHRYFPRDRSGACTLHGRMDRESKQAKLLSRWRAPAIQDGAEFCIASISAWTVHLGFPALLSVPHLLAREVIMPLCGACIGENQFIWFSWWAGVLRIIILMRTVEVCRWEGPVILAAFDGGGRRWLFLDGIEEKVSWVLQEVVFLSESHGAWFGEWLLLGFARVVAHLPREWSHVRGTLLAYSIVERT